MKKFAFIAFIFFPILAFAFNHDVISLVLAISWIFVIIPLVILIAIDFYKISDDSRFHAIHLLLKIPIALFGLFSFVAGLGIIVWVLYNIFIEKQSEYTGPSTIFGGFGIGPMLVGFGFYLIKLSINRQEEY